MWALAAAQAMCILEDVPDIRLALTDAIELAEILQFINDWLATHPDAQNSFADFVGHPAYWANDLRTDLDRFIFLLGGNDGEHLFRSDLP